MGRAKLRMEFIENEKTRINNFEKRRKTLERKASELSTLCGVKIAMVMYGPSCKNSKNEPVIWPKNEEDISFLINSYKSKPGNDCRYRTYDVPAFLKDQTAKVKEEIEKVNKKMKDAKYPKWDERFNNLSQEQLKEFSEGLSKKIEAGRERINLIKSRASERSNFTESNILMKPSVHESTSFMPTSSTNTGTDQLQGMIQWQQPLPYYDHAQTAAAQNQMYWMEMLMNAGTMEDIVRITKPEPLMYIGNSNIHQSPFCLDHANSSSYANFGTLIGDGRIANNDPLRYDKALLAGNLLMHGATAANTESLMYDYTANLMPSSQNRHDDKLWDANFGMTRRNMD